MYLWMGKSPKGPSVKFKVENVHTSRELKMIGNCLKWSRPLLSFDKCFEEETHLKVLKEIFTDTFNAPKNHPKSKPFIDHAINLVWANDRVWFRNYQIFRENVTNKSSTDYELVEIGPRFSMCPVKIFSEFMGGEVLYANSKYVAPRMEGRQKRKELELKFIEKDKKAKRKENLLQKILPSDEIDKLYDNENFFDGEKKKESDHDDSDQYEENDDDFYEE